MNRVMEFLFIILGSVMVGVTFSLLVTTDYVWAAYCALVTVFCWMMAHLWRAR